MDQENAFLALQDNPSKLLELICSHVTSGGSLVALSESWKIPYRTLLKWIREDKARDKAYQEACLDREEWSKDKLLQELRSMTSFNPQSLFDEKGNILPLNLWPEGAAKCIESLEFSENLSGDNLSQLKKIKTMSASTKAKIIETQMKSHGLLTPKVELEAGETLEQLLAGTWGEKSDG